MVRDNWKQAHERYSILTCVQLLGHPTNPDVPPKIAVLFKATPGGRVINELRALQHIPPWIKVQVQTNGSYRSEDVVEALEWMLPHAAHSQDSICVLLDWYSGHLTDEVAECIRKKGHVLLFHGGGCTPFTQVNDTHLRAQLAKLLIQFEIAWKHDERVHSAAAGKLATPKVTRMDLIAFVAAAWTSIDHARVADKAYTQTGPKMPLRGPVHPEDVFGDLLRAMEGHAGPGTGTENIMALRDDAVAFVNAEWEAGRLKTWSDYHTLIEEFDDPDEALAEGLEAFDEIPTSDDDNDDKGDDGDEDGDDDGPDDARLPAKCEDAVDDGSDAGDVGFGDDEGDDDPADADGSEPVKDGGGDVVIVLDSDEEGAGPENTPGASDAGSALDIARARQVLWDHSIRIGDDTTSKRLRLDMRRHSVHQHGASTDVAMALQKRAK